MKNKRIKRNKKYFNSYDLGSWMKNTNEKIDSSKFGSALGGSGGVSALAGGVATTANKLMNPKGNTTGVGNAIEGIGSIASNIPGIGGIVGAGVQVIGGLVNAGFGSNINEEAVDNIENQAARQAAYVSNASDNTSLISDWGNLIQLGEVSKEDIGSEGWFSNKATKKAAELTKKNQEANMAAWQSLQNTADNIENQKAMMLDANFIAEGGALNNGLDNGVTTVNAGGTHEENPYEGVPMGVDYQGIPNLVEEGEVIWNDYVFSNRLKISKNFKKKHKIRGNSFAEAAKELQKESEERPNDPISKLGINANLNELINEQEMIRNKKIKNSNKFDNGGPKTNPLRYTPVLASGASVLNDWLGGNDPDYSNIDLYEGAIKRANKPIGYRPIGQYLDYTPFDTEFYINKLDKNAASGRRAIENTSGGNRVAAVAGILASDYNYGEQLGDLARQAAEFNIANKERALNFNRATDSFNSEMGLKVDSYNADALAREADMYRNLALMRDNALMSKETEHSSNLTNFIESLSGVGQELTDRNTLKWLLDNGVLKGKACGGKIKRKRRFTI